MVQEQEGKQEVKELGEAQRGKSQEKLLLELSERRNNQIPVEPRSSSIRLAGEADVSKQRISSLHTNPAQ